MAILYIHTPTQRLYWKCDRDNCSIRWANLDATSEMADATSEMAVGVLLCPHCQTHQMLHLDVPSNSPEDETEIQCTNTECNLAMYMFELPLVMQKMGAFDLRRLQPM